MSSFIGERWNQSRWKEDPIRFPFVIPIQLSYPKESFGWQSIIRGRHEIIETKTSTADSILKRFDSIAEKIHLLRNKRANLLKELKAIDEDLQILETNHTTMQEEILELADIPSKHEDAISR